MPLAASLPNFSDGICSFSSDDRSGVVSHSEASCARNANGIAIAATANTTPVLFQLISLSPKIPKDHFVTETDFNPNAFR
jgi:hypothetical protein